MHNQHILQYIWEATPRLFSVQGYRGIEVTANGITNVVTLHKNPFVDDYENEEIQYVGTSYTMEFALELAFDSVRKDGYKEGYRAGRE